MRAIFALVSILPLCILGCGSDEDQPTTARRPDPPSEIVVPVVPDPDLDTAPPARPVDIVVLNDTDETVVFERTFGPLSPITLARLEGPLPPGVTLDQHDDARSGRWVETCECECVENTACPECESPDRVSTTLAPGESAVLPWSGRLWRRPASRGCHEVFDPLAGSYVMTVCFVEGGCASVLVTLPSTAPIEIHASVQAHVTGCGDIPAYAARNVQQGTHQTVREMFALFGDPRGASECPLAPTCVEPDALASTLAEAGPGDCLYLQIARGDEVEYLVHMPLPEGTAGGENYARFYDPAGTRLLHVRYEQ